MPISRWRGFTAVGWGATLPRHGPERCAKRAGTGSVTAMPPVEMGDTRRVAAMRPAAMGTSVRSRRCVPPQWGTPGASRQCDPLRWEHPSGRGDASRRGDAGRVAPQPTAGDGATFGGGRTFERHPVGQRARMPIISMPISRWRGFTAVGWGATLPRRGPERCAKRAGTGPVTAMRPAAMGTPVGRRRCVPPQWEHPSGRGAASRAGTGSVAAIRPAAMGHPSDRGDASRRNRARSAPTKKPAVRRVFSRRAGTGRPYGIGWLTPSRTVRTGAGSGRRSHRPPGW